MLGDISRDLAAAGRMANVNRSRKIEGCDQFGQIICIDVHIISMPRLAGTPTPTTVMRDDAVAAFCQEKHLILEGMTAQRPTMAEYDVLSCTPIAVVDIGTVPCSEGRHWKTLSLAAARRSRCALG